MKKRSKLILMLLLMVLVTSFIGCSDDNTTKDDDLEESDPATLKVTTNYNQESEIINLKDLEVTYSNGEEEHTKEVMASNKEFAIDDLETGDWDISIKGKGIDYCYYKGAATTTITEDDITEVDVTLDLLGKQEVVESAAALNLSVSLNQTPESKISDYAIHLVNDEQDYLTKVDAGADNYAFTDLESGEWGIFVVAKDEEGRPKYKGQTTAKITNDDSTAAEVTLKKQDILNDLKDGQYNDEEDYDITTNWIGVGHQWVGLENNEQFLPVTAIDLNEIDLQKLNYNYSQGGTYNALTFSDFEEEIINYRYEDSRAETSLVKLRDKVISETKMDEKSVIVGEKHHIAHFQLGMGIPKLNDNAQNWLDKTSVKAFEEAYGEMFINRVDLGTEMHLIYRATAAESLTEEEKKELKIKIQESKTHIFNENTTSLTAGFSDNEVENYEIAIKIYTFDQVLEFKPGNNDAQEIRSAYNQINENVENKRNLGVLNYNLANYPIYHIK